jgi:phosphopantetheinyl transferase
MQLPEKYRYRGFYNCWTQKEAITKAIGEGLSFPLNEIKVSLTPEEKPISIKVVDKAGGQLHSLLLETFKINNHFVGAAAILDQVEQILYLRVDQYDDLSSKFDKLPYT